MPQGLHHRRHGPQRLRDRARPAARVDRDHDGPPREAGPRGAPGRHRPRAVARPQLRHPVRAARRRPRRRDRPARRLLPALHVLGRRRPPAATATAAAAALQASCSSSRSSSPSSRPIVGAFVQLAVSRQREYLADASSVELTRNPYGLERALAKIAADQEVLEVANRGDAAPVLHEPDQEVRGARDGPVLDPPADRRPDQPAPRADRRAAAGPGRRGRR